MKKLAVAEFKEALSSMKEELQLIKKEAEEFMEDFEDTGPEDILLDEDLDKEEVNEEGKEKEPDIKIETPEDAKKVLDEAKEDIQAVIDNLDGVIGEGEEEVEKIAFKRFNEKYASTLKEIGGRAKTAISETKDALKHWSFLKKRIKKKEAKIDTSKIKNSQLKQAADTLHEMSVFEKMLDKLGFVRKSTAVPPTGAEFSGNKWPEGKNPAEVELRHWESGASKYNKDKKFEDSRPNAAVEHRLDTSEYSRNDQPFVNASLKIVNDPVLGKTASYWNVYDSKTKKSFNLVFKDASPKLGPKNEEGFKNFASKKFGQLLIDTVIEEGIDNVKAYANGQFSKTAAVDDKSSLRKYYSDAYGDKGYSKELTSGANTENMNTAYKPKKDKVENSEDNPEFGKAKDGPGKISAKEKEEMLVKARRGVEIAKKAAAGGVIDFNKAAIKEYTKKLMKKSDKEINAIEETLNELPLVNEAALKEATIPDADSGIVGNSLTGVSNPEGKSNTEGIDSNVASDAKISKKAGFVPQTNIQPTSNLQVSSAFTTTAKRLQEKGVDLNNIRLRKASYRNS